MMAWYRRRVARPKKVPATKQRTRTPAMLPKRADATSPAIERLFAELERDPTNEGATLVLADALAELGDIRAELAHVQHAIATASKAERSEYQLREKTLIHALRGRLLGRQAANPEITTEIRLGFVRELSLVNLAPRELAEVLASVLPSSDARLLETLHIAWDGEEAIGLGDVFESLAGEVSPQSVRRLVLGRSFAEDPADRVVEQTFDDDGELVASGAEDLRKVLTLFPRMRELVIDLGAVPVRLPTLATKNLEALTWITPRLTAAELAPLGNATLPALRRFELWIGGAYGHDDGEMRDGEEPGDDLEVLESLPLEHLEPVLAMLDRCTELREVVFGHCHRHLKLLERLRAHPFLGRLETFGLAHVDIDDAGELIAFMTATPTLKKLVLDGVLADDATRLVLARRLGSRLRAGRRSSSGTSPATNDVHGTRMRRALPGASPRHQVSLPREMREPGATRGLVRSVAGACCRRLSRARPRTPLLATLDHPLRVSGSRSGTSSRGMMPS
jgi:hypothetical protein